MPKKVLIIDDEPEISKMVTEFLIGSGYAAYYALNGPDGLALIKKEKPDLVLLDIGMPGMDGLEVLRLLRDAPSPSSMTVVVLSAHKEAEMVKKALELGASEYITKPINLETLLNHFVKDLLGSPL